MSDNFCIANDVLDILHKTKGPNVISIYVIRFQYSSNSLMINNSKTEKHIIKYDNGINAFHKITVHPDYRKSTQALKRHDNSKLRF